MAIAAADFHLKTLLSLTFVSVLGVEALAALADLLVAESRDCTGELFFLSNLS